MRLELNTNGAWRLVLAGLCGQQIDRARDAAATLAALDTGKRPHVWRLVDYDGSVVAHCDGPAGWRRNDDGGEVA